MTTTPSIRLWVGALLLCGAGAAAAQQPLPRQQDFSGSSLFRTYCASCHGTEARGNGPLAEHLRVRPSDLTQIANRHEGKFPAEKVHKIIDGRQPVKGHGGGDMPVWGDAFKNALEGSEDETIKAKIEALVDHLATIQAPKK